MVGKLLASTLNYIFTMPFLLNIFIWIKHTSLVPHLLCSYCFSPGISASYQKWRGTKEAQQTHQHYLIGQTVHNCPQHHRSVLDLRNWTGKLIIILPSTNLWIQVLQHLFDNGSSAFYGKRWKVSCGLIKSSTPITGTLV